MKSLSKIICIVYLFTASVAFAENINIAADKMYFEKGSDLVHYEGNVKLRVNDVVNISSSNVKKEESGDISTFSGNVKIVVSGVIFSTDNAVVSYSEKGTIVTMSKAVSVRP